MTNEELKDAFNSMPREAFEEMINGQGLRLIVDTQGINGQHSAPMYYVESSILTPIAERREPLYLGS